MLNAYVTRLISSIAILPPASKPDSIATALHCSKRHLHNAFADEDDTLNAYILRQRLAACMRALQDPAHARRPITDIALSSGFGNLSHFSRVFRQQTGGSPSEFRRRVGLSLGPEPAAGFACLLSAPRIPA